MTDVQKTLTPSEKKQQEENRLSTMFEKAAVGVARLFAVGIDDVRSAYEGKKKSLTIVYNEASEAKSDRAKWAGWSVFWGVVLWPIALYTGYKAVNSHMDFRNLKNEVVREVETYRAKASASEAHKVKPSPFGTRIKA